MTPVFVHRRNLVLEAETELRPRRESVRTINTRPALESIVKSLGTVVLFKLGQVLIYSGQVLLSSGRLETSMLEGFWGPHAPIRPILFPAGFNAKQVE